MRVKTALLSLGIALALTTGCYNNPETSLKKPGEGPQDIHSKPSVGPGTAAGGSTAGPQPAPRTEEGGHGGAAKH